MPYKKIRWGELPGKGAVDLYTLTNEHGLSASFTNLGGVWVSMIVPDKEGKNTDVVLGYDTIEAYAANPPHFGAPIGRYANRIAKARFTLKGRTYDLEANNGPNNLHSGPDYYHGRLWEACAEENELGLAVHFSLHSPDGDQGYPGNADIRVSYTLTPDDSLVIDYHMVSDADTIVNLTNHSYFNLSGHSSGCAMDDRVWIDADQFTPADAVSIPTGEFLSVEGTPMDFRTMKPIGRDLSADYEALILGQGYDHNWVLNHPRGEVCLCAAAESDRTGIRMEVYTDMPGMQFYTGNFLEEGTAGKRGAVYGRRHAYCFETQNYPNAVNTPQFPSAVLKAQKEYRTTTVYHFGLAEAEGKQKS